ncbi:EscU/YscU/HrcU family type III secretion system export apparatus switch protein [Marilutibacter alkalisoli]|uniref:Flagellar biosynthetic protein FlhB n=1 Tax=Marilutibacter alkalisoli TaxID=2591633 RepID=A0A514BRY4_9GAMM|nr:EscU/YscU/HrcU family type III secretion system export apparatus switch protein [Lysobacter alkalisoli]QDH70158.1 EscU/YscU/HrcU family type III secretion system export apparatus switch protein [Lysobacter alkalisoli]
MSQDQDKSEQPTPFKLDEARKKGEVAKSMDVTGSLVMIVFAVIVALTGVGIAMSLAGATRRMIELAGNVPALDAAFVGWTMTTYAPMGQAVMPLVLGLIVAAILGNFLQTGPIFTTHPLKPDFKRLNPAQVVKRIFSIRTLWELGKLVLKLLLLVGVCAIFVWKGRALIEAVAMTLPQRVGSLLLSTFVKTSIYVLLVLALVALADLLFVRREYMRKMRMSRRELKDEVKQRDGDPSVKSKQKQQIRELLKKARALGRVPDADVVLTNPTHVAVALRYRPGETLAPLVIAKGAGFLSRQIRTVAARHRVPIVRVPGLARVLYRECEIDGMVPELHYHELVPIYRALWAGKQGVPA